MKDLKTFTVKTESWDRGSGNGLLLNLACGQGCCLGHLMNESGIPAGALHGKDIPAHVNLGSPEGEFPKWMTDLKWQRLVADVNDNKQTTDEEKMIALTSLFARKRIEVNFVSGKREW